MKDSPRGWSQLFARICTDFGQTRLKSDESVSVKFVNNSKTRIQNEQPTLANIVEATAHVPENDGIYSDCPHATAILVIASYVDDNLAFTKCAALAAEFEVHCNVKFPMNAEGPVNSYLSIEYDRGPITKAVSARKHLYIDKLLKKWGIAVPQKADGSSTNPQNLSQFTRNLSKDTKHWLAFSSICKYILSQKYLGQYRD